MSAGADKWIKWTAIGCVALLALIAGTVSYLHMHMHMLVARHGQPGWVAALTPLSVDGMIVAASTTLPADSRSGGKGGTLPWALLVAGSVASLAANVAVAQPTLIGRVIAAWPSFALTASYELLTRQIRCRAADEDTQDQRRQDPHPPGPSTVTHRPAPGFMPVGQRGYVYYDPGSDGPVPGPDGKPLVFSLDEVMAASSGAPAPNVWQKGAADRTGGW